MGYTTEAAPDDVIDFDIQPEGDLPPGRWDVTVIKVINATSKAGNDYKQLVFLVIPDEHTLNHPDWEQWQNAEVLCKQPWALNMVMSALGYVTEDPITRRKHATATVGQVLQKPLVIDLTYKTTPGFDKPLPQVAKVYDPQDAPRDDLGAYDQTTDTPMGVENEGAIFTPEPPLPAPAGRVPVTSLKGR